MEVLLACCQSKSVVIIIITRRGWNCSKLNHLNACDTKGSSWCPHSAVQNPGMKTPEILQGLFCSQMFFFWGFIFNKNVVGTFSHQCYFSYLLLLWCCHEGICWFTSPMSHCGKILTMYLERAKPRNKPETRSGWFRNHATVAPWNNVVITLPRPVKVRKCGPTS